MLQNVGVDGIIYAEVALDEPVTTRFSAARKQEELTEYSELDYNKMKPSYS